MTNGTESGGLWVDLAYIGAWISLIAGLVGLIGAAAFYFEGEISPTTAIALGTSALTLMVVCAPTLGCLATIASRKS